MTTTQEIFREPEYLCDSKDNGFYIEVYSKEVEKTSEKILYLSLKSISGKISLEQGVSTRATDFNITKLKKSDKLQRIGIDKGGHWKIKKWKTKLLDICLEN